MLYYSNKKWSQAVTFFKNCKEYNNNKGILLSDNEYLLYCYTEDKYLQMVKLDKNFIVKDTNEEEKCFFDLEIEGCSIIYASSLLYNKYKYTYFLSISCLLNIDYISRNDELQSECSYKSQLSDFEYYQQSDGNIFSSTYVSSLPTKFILSTSFSNLRSSSLIYPSSLLTSETSFLTSKSSTIIQKETIKEIISTSQVFLNSESTYLTNILSTNIINKINIVNNYEFYIEGDIIKGKINKTKEEIEDNLGDIMNIIEIGKKYEINGNDYNISISPVDIISSFQTSFITEFSANLHIINLHFNNFFENNKENIQI